MVSGNKQLTDRLDDIKSELDHIKKNMVKKDELREFGTGLKSPKEVSMKRRLQDSLSNIKILSNKEREKRKKEVDNLRKEMSEKEFQKHLLKEFGLQ